MTKGQGCGGTSTLLICWSRPWCMIKPMRFLSPDLFRSVLIYRAMRWTKAPQKHTCMHTIPANQMGGPGHTQAKGHKGDPESTAHERPQRKAGEHICARQQLQKIGEDSVAQQEVAKESSKRVRENIIGVNRQDSILHGPIG